MSAQPPSSSPPRDSSSRDNGNGGPSSLRQRPSHGLTKSASSLDLTGAAIVGEKGEKGDGAFVPRPSKGPDEAPIISLPNQHASGVSHFAIDIGGSLIKLIYFSPAGWDTGDAPDGDAGGAAAPPGESGGRLHFIKFETSQLDQCLDFIRSKGLHRQMDIHGRDLGKMARVKATGGGAFKFSDQFAASLGLHLEKEDEMECMVVGANFFFRAIRDEVFAYADGQRRFLPLSSLESNGAGPFPYLLVSIGSGVSMIKVDDDFNFERVSGSSLGGGTFWGLCRLLTGARNFDEMLDIAAKGDNSKVDMLVGDIYGGLDYAKIGLSATTIASSFGRVVSDRDKVLSDYEPADMALALMRMVSYNIGHLAYLNATRYGIKRVFFGGFFIRGHPYTMETISFAIKFWSKGQMEALFLRHEGFLGAMGAFLRGPSLPLEVMEPLGQAIGVSPAANPLAAARPGSDLALDRLDVVGAQVGAAAAALSSGEGAVVEGPHLFDPSQAAARSSVGGLGSAGDLAAAYMPGPASPSSGPLMGAGALGGGSGLSRNRGSSKVRSKFVERFSMGAPLFGGEIKGPPISSLDEKISWVEKFANMSATTLGHSPSKGSSLASLAAAAGSDREDDSGGGGRGRAPAGQGQSQAQGQGKAAAGPTWPSASPSPRQLHLHVGVLHFQPTLEPFPLLADPESYEPSTIDLSSNPAEARYWIDVLGQGVPTLVAKAAASEGATEESNRRAHAFGLAFSAHLQRLREEPGAYGKMGLGDLFELREDTLREFYFRDAYRLEKDREARVALAVLSDLLRELDEVRPEPAEPGGPAPWPRPANARERLQAVIQGALAGNIFDWGAKSCVQLYEDGQILDIYRSSRQRLSRRPWRVDLYDRFEERVLGASKDEAEAEQEPERGAFHRVLIFVDNHGADAILGMLPLAREMLRLGAEVVLACNSLPAINDVTAGEMREVMAAAARVCQVLGDAYRRGLDNRARSPGGSVPPPDPPAAAAGPGSAPAAPPALYVVATGHGSPCLDLRRVSRELAEACSGVDLIVIEGMGRALHTNLRARFRCASLKLAMVKNAHLAKTLFGGELYDCICLFEEGVRGTEDTEGADSGALRA